MAKPVKKQKGVPKTSVFLVEDHPVFRDGLSKLLNAEDDLQVIGEAGDAAEGLKSIVKHKPDLVVVDIGLPGKSGLELIKEVRDLKLATKMLAVSMFDEAIYAQRVLRAGGDGYVMKQEDPEVIILAIRDVLAGHIYVSEDVFAKDALKPKSKKETPSLAQLTDSELEVLELLGLGKSSKEIANQVGLSTDEFNAHTNSIRRKLRLSGDNALIRYAVCWVEDSSK
jgi:DNA-binding NarL/FixJ family response regulator